MTMLRTAAIAVCVLATVASAQTSRPLAVPAPEDVAAPTADAEKTSSGLASKSK